jgi:hypothetical protein
MISTTTALQSLKIRIALRLGSSSLPNHCCQVGQWSAHGNSHRHPDQRCNTLDNRWFLAWDPLLCNSKDRRRILDPGVPHRIFLWTSTLLCWASLNVCIPVLLTSCDPAKGLWDVQITKKSCRSPWILIYYSMYTGCKHSNFSWLATTYVGQRFRLR